MSLLSVHNFLVPLTNKVHLTTIVLVAILFGAYRLAGGGVRIENSRSVRDETTLNPRAEVERLGGLKRPSRNGESDVLRDMIGSKREEQKRPGRSSALDDVEKALGMR